MNAAALDLARFEAQLLSFPKPGRPIPLTMSLADVGRWFLDKWRQRLKDSDTFTVARQMRKQGIPLEIALFTLTRF